MRILGTDQWLTTTTYYNDKGHAIQVIADNSVGGKDIATTLYDFNGKVLSNYLRHGNPRSVLTPQTTVLTMLSYDAGGRLLSVKKRLNDDVSQDKTIVANIYDELGQLKQKRLGVTGTSSQLDSLSYTYNIRGWLQGINKAFVNTTNSKVNWFGQELNYDYGFSINQYNGNIAGVKWKSGSDGIARAYGYNYDRVNRLTIADFTQQNTNEVAWTRNKMDFSVSNLTYDANGNIKTMNQQGMIGAAINPIDKLTYAYSSSGSNKLLSVSDASNTASSKLGDFIDGTNTGNDYSYDNNGNLVTDQNKGISTISYNHLNLPSTIQITGKRSINYLYDAAGNKLKKTVVDNTVTPSKTTITDYIGGFVYKQDTLELVSHEEGRIRPVYVSGQPVKYSFDYFEKDHLGNVWVVLTDQTDFSVYSATMETAVAAKETALFSNVEETRAEKPVGYPEDGTTDTNAFVAKLNAKTGGKKIGPSLVLRVMAGDTVQINAKAFYKSGGPQNNGATPPVEDMLAGLVQAFSSGTTADGSHATGGVDNATPFNSDFYNNSYRRLKEKNRDAINPDRPKAYLNFVLFDDQFKLVDDNSGVRQVKATPDELQELKVEPVVMEKSGFLYVYTSNETEQDVFFDNVILGLASGPVLEETHYYPFGLTMAGISSNALKGANYPENRAKYNGKELQSKEFGDGSGLELYDYGARMYDVQIGRWKVVDPHLEKYEAISPYVYTYNNPIRFIDIKGEDPGDIAILFTGADFGQGMTPTTLQIASGVQKEMNGGSTITYSSIYYWGKNDATQRAYEEILKNHENDPNGKILLYGYSYGGVLVNHLAKRLEKVGITVDILVTVDAANGWGSDKVDRTIGENVKRNENYFETNVDSRRDPTKSHGAENHGKAKQINNHDKSKGSYNGKMIDHMNIDDATVKEITKTLVDVLNNMKDGETKTLKNEDIQKLLR